MKKLLLAPLALLAASAALASPLAIRELNAEVAKLLAPYQSNSTTAKVVFSKLVTNADHALSAQVAVLFKKVGRQNTVEINVPELSYEYGNGTAPTTKLTGAIKLDFTKLISQDQVNELIPGVEDIIEGLARGFAEQYGDAATIEAKVSEKNKDSEGNYISLKGSIKFKIDLTKLPNTVKAEDVPVLNGSVEVGLDVSTGALISAVVVSNPGYNRFQRENIGLKETVDRLLAKDPELLRQINDALAKLEKFADSFVNGSN
jgi:hypothetical protein